MPTVGVHPALVLSDRGFTHFEPGAPAESTRYDEDVLWNDNDSDGAKKGASEGGLSVSGLSNKTAARSLSL